jgi:hypothetical protein
MSNKSNPVSLLPHRVIMIDCAAASEKLAFKID